MFRHALPVAVLVSLCAISSQPALARASQAPSHAAAKPAATGIVNLNTATAADLEALPGIGAKTAARIVEYRQKNGPFKKAEELMNVRGVGEKSFVKMKPLISVTPARGDHTTQ